VKCLAFRLQECLHGNVGRYVVRQRLQAQTYEHAQKQ
jgi:hypothetical protein